MSVITPTPITALPPAPVKGQAGFNAAAELYLAALVNPFTPQVNAAIAVTNSNALSAEQSAITAQAATAGISVDLWVDNKNYTVGESVKSPAALLAGASNPIYICKLDTGGVHIDPYFDSAHWSIFAITGATGGAVYTTSTTLTASSPFAISIAGGAGVWLKLPDATTLQSGAKYHVSNAGTTDLKVIDGGGNTLGFVRPKSSSALSLADLSTSAGVWCHELEIDGITDDFALQFSTASLSTMRAIVPLDTSRTAYLYGATNLWAVVYDTSTQSLGSPTLIRSGVGYATAFKSAADQICILSVDNSTYTALQCVAVSIAGTAIGTIPTPTPVTLASGIDTAWGQSVAVGSSFVTSYHRSGVGAIRPIMVSSGVVTIGSEESLGTAYPPRLYVSGSILRVIYFSGNLYCKPYSISGAVLTAGTAASETTSTGTMPEQIARSFILNNAIWVFHGAYSCTVFTLSGTTESKSTVTALPYISGALGSNFYYDISIISNTNVAICGQTDLTNGVVSCNVITNTNGTITVGTASTDSFGLSGNFYISETKPNGNNVAFVVYSATYQYTFLNKYDCSTASPIKSKQGQLTNRVAAIQGAKNQLNQASPALLFGGNYLIKYRDYTEAANPFNAFCINSENAIPVAPAILAQHPNFRDINYGKDGASYCITSCGNPSSNLGIHIQKVEVAK